MRDNQELMIKFTKIIERYPEIYNQNLEAYKTRQVERAWEKVAVSVRVELEEECTVEELKTKWKGIRSSFNRYKNKLLNPAEAGTCKKYYLYDSLRYLDPYTKPKGLFRDSAVDDCGLCNDDSKGSNHSSEEWSIADPNFELPIKQLDSDLPVHERLSHLDTSDVFTNNDESKKIKLSIDEKPSILEDNEDLQFFRSILPDIRYFTNREKRKLKMGILRLIDDLENERKHHH